MRIAKRKLFAVGCFASLTVLGFQNCGRFSPTAAEDSAIGSLGQSNGSQSTPSSAVPTASPVPTPSPIQLKTAGDVASISSSTTYSLINDIDLAGQSLPPKLSNVVIFGNGFTIKNIAIDCDPTRGCNNSHQAIDGTSFVNSKLDNLKLEITSDISTLPANPIGAVSVNALNFSGSTVTNLELKYNLKGTYVRSGGDNRLVLYSIHARDHSILKNINLTESVDIGIGGLSEMIWLCQIGAVTDSNLSQLRASTIAKIDMPNGDNFSQFLFDAVSGTSTVDSSVINQSVQLSAGTTNVSVIAKDMLEFAQKSSTISNSTFAQTANQSLFLPAKLLTQDTSITVVNSTHTWTQAP